LVFVNGFDPTKRQSEPRRSSLERRRVLADRTRQVAETKKRVNVYSFRFNIGIFFGIINQDADLMNNYPGEKTRFSSRACIPLRGALQTFHKRVLCAKNEA
jgi:hypothetical protein